MPATPTPIETLRDFIHAIECLFHDQTNQRVGAIAESCTAARESLAALRVVAPRLKPPHPVSGMTPDEYTHRLLCDAAEAVNILAGPFVETCRMTPLCEHETRRVGELHRKLKDRELEVENLPAHAPEAYPARYWKAFGITGDDLRTAKTRGEVGAILPHTRGNPTGHNLYVAADVRAKWPHKTVNESVKNRGNA